MKRHLDCKDYERMTFESVAERYEAETEQHKLHMVSAMLTWDATKLNGYTASTKESVFRKRMLKMIYDLESDVFSTSRTLAHMIRDNPKTYRISINQKGGAEVLCFDLENIDSELEGYYDDLSNLPTWVQERIAVLSVCSPNPPTPVVEGIGRRISESIYWIYK